MRNGCAAENCTVDAASLHVVSGAWPAPAQMPWRSDKVRCGLRGGVDLGSCSCDGTRASSTIAVVS